MIKLYWFVVLFLFFPFVYAKAQKTNSKRVVIIGLDGLSVPGFQTAKHPNIDSLFANGVVSLTTRPVMPSVTLPNWTTHLSGAGPEEHGVTANNWTLKDHPLQAIETDTDGYFPSIFKVLKETVPHVKTAFYYNWKELINSMNQRYLDEVSFEDSDRFESNYSKAINFIKKNKSEPALIFLYSVHTDHAGHSHKWMSPEYIAAIKKADTAIGKFIYQLKADHLYDDTHFFLITDHGGNPESGHGGVSMDEMQVPWAITGPQIKRLGKAIFYNSNKNTSLVIAKIFGVKKVPECWTGTLPNIIYK